MTFKFFGFPDLCREVGDHDFGFGGDRFVVAFDFFAEFVLGFGGVEEGIVLDGFLDFVVAAISGVGGEYVENEAFFNRLFHGVQMEGNEFSIGVFVAEFFEGGVFWGGGEGEVGGVFTKFATVHCFEDFVLEVFGFFVVAAEGGIHFVGGLSTLGGVGFVDDYGEVSIA